MPLCRVACVTPSIGPTAFAIVFRTTAILGAALGSYHAVSGASAAIAGVVSYPYYSTNPITFNAVGKVGAAFNYRIIVSGNNPDTNVDYYAATPLPPGLTINTNLGQPGFISGKPTVAGVTFPVTLTAGNLYYDQDGGTPIHTNITITIATSSGNYAPSFTTQPDSSTATNGGRASFSATAIGSPAPVYRWRENGANLSGATNNTYAIASVTTNDGGGYSVVASNSSGSATSQVATLTVLVPASITTQPQSRTGLEGTTATFSSAVSGIPPPAYQWLKDATNISGATGSSYSIPSLGPTDAGDYTVVASNSVNTITSQVARLNVVHAPVLANVGLMGNKVTFGFTREAGPIYDVLWSAFLPATNWPILANFPVVSSNSSVSMTNSTTNSDSRFYRIRMTIP